MAACFRFSPRDAKVWKYVIKSDFIELDGKSGQSVRYRHPHSRTNEISVIHPYWWIDDPDPTNRKVFIQVQEASTDGAKSSCETLPSGWIAVDSGSHGTQAGKSAKVAAKRVGRADYVKSNRPQLSLANDSANRNVGPASLARLAGPQVRPIPTT